MVDHKRQRASARTRRDGAEPARRPILFVTFTGRRPSEALARAVALAARLDAPLAILLVSWDDALRADTRSDERWYRQHVPYRIAHRAHHVVGHLVPEAIRHADLLAARMVVLPGEIGRSGSCVSAIAASAGIPVLIAHAPTGGDSIVAATALRDDRFPVVQEAANLVGRLDATLVGVHDLEGTVSVPEIERRRCVLATALEPISLTYETVIDCEPDPADAVLSAARERDADLIAVGVPRRTWLDAVVHPTVASRVVAGARRSILLVPLECYEGEAIPRHVSD